MEKKHRSTGEDLKFYKFVVNNNDDSRIQCVIWNEDIEKFQNCFEVFDVRTYIEHKYFTSYNISIISQYLVYCR